MERYTAFLRGVNVSGQKLLKMEHLRTALTEAGITGVKTYIQSGNVLFDSDESDTEKLNFYLENLIEKTFGFRTDVILRRKRDLNSILSSLQLCKLETGEDRKYYITLLKQAYSEPFTVPFFSKNKDVEVIYHNKMDFISISLEYKGNYGFPNAFIEKLSGFPATTRNPITLGKILDI